MFGINEKFKKGFTLVETLLYVVFISIILASFIGFGISIGDIRNKIDINQQSQENIRAVIDFMKTHIKESDVVLNPTSISTSSTLSLQNAVDPDVTFLVIDGQINYYLDLGSPEPLTNRQTTISNLVFKNLGSDNQSDSIHISFDVSARNAASVHYKYDKHIETTITKRK